MPLSKTLPETAPAEEGEVEPDSLSRAADETVHIVKLACVRAVRVAIENAERASAGIAPHVAKLVAPVGPERDLGENELFLIDAIGARAEIRVGDSPSGCRASSRLEDAAGHDGAGIGEKGGEGHPLRAVRPAKIRDVQSLERRRLVGAFRPVERQEHDAARELALGALDRVLRDEIAGALGRRCLVHDAVEERGRMKPKSARALVNLGPDQGRREEPRSFGLEALRRERRRRFEDAVAVRIDLDLELLGAEEIDDEPRPVRSLEVDRPASSDERSVAVRKGNREPRRNRISGQERKRVRRGGRLGDDTKAALVVREDQGSVGGFERSGRIESEREEVRSGGGEPGGLSLVAGRAPCEAHRVLESERERIPECPARRHRVQERIEARVLRGAAVEVEQESPHRGVVVLAKLHSESGLGEKEGLLDDDASADSTDARGESSRGGFGDAPALAQHPHPGSDDRLVEGAGRSREHERIRGERNAVGDPEGEMDAPVDYRLSVEPQIARDDLSRSKGFEVIGERRELARLKGVDALARGGTRYELEAAQRPVVEGNVDAVRDARTDVVNGDEELELLVGANDRGKGERQIEERLSNENASRGPALERDFAADEPVENRVDVERERMEALLLAPDQELCLTLLARVQGVVPALSENREGRRLDAGC